MAISFQTAVTYFPGTFPGSVTTVDVNGDSKPDIVVAEGGSNNGDVFVLLNDGTGGFGPATSYATGGGRLTR